MSKDLAQQIKAARTAQRISGDELARRIGTTQSTIDRIENGGAKRSKYLYAAAVELGIDPIPFLKASGQAASAGPGALSGSSDRQALLAAFEGALSCLLRMPPNAVSALAKSVVSIADSLPIRIESIDMTDSIRSAAFQRVAQFLDQNEIEKS